MSVSIATRVWDENRVPVLGLVREAEALRGAHLKTPAATWSPTHALSRVRTWSTSLGLPSTCWALVGGLETYGTATAVAGIAVRGPWEIAAVAQFDLYGSTHYYEWVEPPGEPGSRRGVVLDCTALLEAVLIAELLGERSPEEVRAVATAATLCGAVSLVRRAVVKEPKRKGRR